MSFYMTFNRTRDGGLVEVSIVCVLSSIVFTSHKVQSVRWFYEVYVDVVP